MSAPTLGEAGAIIVKKAPVGLSKRMFYLAKRSNAPGVIPEHLKAYTEKFTAQAPKCSAAIRDVPSGPQKVLAMRACMANNL